jgi:hypothetical protein
MQSISVRNLIVRAAFLAVLPLQVHAAVIYVDVDAIGADNGTDWANAHRELQSALAHAAWGDEIWVAEGVYRPDYDPVSKTYTGNPAAYFDSQNVSFYGGFNGTEPIRELRDPELHPTILTGDLAGNDGPDFTGYEENTVCMVRTNEGLPIIVDGFQIRHVKGMGIDVSSGSLVLRNCRFAHVLSGPAVKVVNYAYPEWFSTEFDNCTFEHNRSDLIRVERTKQTTITNCRFTDNSASYPTTFLYSGAAGAVSVFGCEFTDNVCNSGAMLRGVWSDCGALTLDNCTFTRNSVQGAVAWPAPSNIRNCSFVENASAVSISSSSTFRNVRFLRNTGPSSAVSVAWSEASFIDCVFSGNCGDSVSAVIAKTDARVSMINCTIVNNFTFRTSSGSAIRGCGGKSIHLDNCILWGNTNPSGAGESAQLDVSDWCSYERVVNYCCIEGLTGQLGGVGNTGAAPVFVDADGPDNVAGTPDDDLRLAAGSPCIDAGNNTAVPSGITEDLAGRPRFVDDPAQPDTGNGTAPIVDMGALESQESIAAMPEVVYVRAAASGEGTGRDWANAFATLKPALKLAHQGGGRPVEIWVAAGRYKPDKGTDQYEPSFYLRRAPLYGGFAGTETSREQRNPAVNETVLTGDLADDDGPLFTGMDENIGPIIYAEAMISDGCVLDGFTLSGGKVPADTFTGAAMKLAGNPVVRNCRITGNGDRSILVENGASPRIDNCLLSENQGSCIYVNRGSPGITNSIFERNGGAIRLEGADLTVQHCRFIRNVAHSGVISSGGYPAGHVAIHNCLFDGNVGSGGNAALSLATVSLTVSQCTFVHNQAAPHYAVVGAYGGTVSISNSILIHDGASYSVILSNSSTTGNLFNNVLPGGQASIQTIYDAVLNYGPGMIEADPLFFDADGPDNVAGTADDDLRLAVGSPAIDAGDNAAVPADIFDLDGDGDVSEPLPYDLGRLARLVDDPTAADFTPGVAANVDIGAYEYQDDCDGNGLLDSVDLRDGTGSDCNANLVLDACDIASNASNDCNANGVPDECELAGQDCNRNGIPDACEPDADADGVPDDCDQCPGTEPGTPVGADGCRRPTPGDFNGDFDVDQEDFGAFQACLTGAGFAQLDPACQKARLDADGDVDEQDVGMFLRCRTAPGEIGDPDCNR